MLYRSFNQKFILGSWTKVLNFLLKKIKNDSGFVCLPCSLNDLSQQEKNGYQEAYQSVDYSTADGKPLVFYFRYFKKIKPIDRIYGPDLMKNILHKTQGHKHFFCGSTEKTLIRLNKVLKKKYPKLKTFDTYSPPFTNPNTYQTKLVEKLKNSSTEILWIALPSPKQVLLASYIKEQLPNLNIFCVGAAFDFLSGGKKQAPVIMQKSGFEWLYRLIQEPRRLGKRYLLEIPLFIINKLIKKFGLNFIN